MKIAAFNAIRPGTDKVHLVATRSYVSYTLTQLRKKLNENPFSFLHIIHPDLGARKIHTSKSTTERYQKVRKKFDEFMEEGILSRDAKPSLYIYRQIKKGHAFTGLIAAVSVDDYLTGKVKKHEQTLSKRQERFTTYLEHTRINAEPVLLTYSGEDVPGRIFEKYMSQRAEYDFTQTTRVRHQLWVVNDEEDVNSLVKAFGKIPAFYIADGHHRCASSALLWEKKKKEGPGPRDYFLSLILHESNVKIYDFNRLVRDLGKYTPESFLHAIDAHFIVEPQQEIYRPVCKGEFSMYLEHQWYRLRLRPGHDFTQLDAQVLTDQVLRPLLGISDLRKDKRISFVEGPQGMEGLKKLVDRGKYKVAFGLFPVSTSELKFMADNELTMPPKSTWIEPKLRSGMVIYELS